MEPVFGKQEIIGAGEKLKKSVVSKDRRFDFFFIHDRSPDNRFL